MGMLAYPEVLQYRHRDLATCLISKSSLEYRLAVRVVCVYGVTLPKKVEVRKIFHWTLNRGRTDGQRGARGLSAQHAADESGELRHQ
jgi:hypothetical protein